MALRWHTKQGHPSEQRENPKVDRFLEDILAVCRYHELMIEHEDGHGAFIIAPITEDGESHLQRAMIDDDR